MYKLVCNTCRWENGCKLYRFVAYFSNELISFIHLLFCTDAALESMGNVLRMMLGGEDGYDDEDFEELKENEDDGADGSCQNEQQQPPPPQGDFDLNLDEIDGDMEEPMMLDTDSE